MLTRLQKNAVKNTSIFHYAIVGAYLNKKKFFFFNMDSCYMYPYLRA